MIQAGDPTGTGFLILILKGRGGQSIYGKEFEDGK
jgi:hypothetical protein